MDEGGGGGSFTCESAQTALECSNSSVEGRGLCTADGHGTLECRGGVLVKTKTDSDCQVQNGLVTCTP